MSPTPSLLDREDARLMWRLWIGIAAAIAGGLWLAYALFGSGA